MKKVATSHDRAPAAFSLIELLGVIATIGILAALLMTVIPAMVEAAKIRTATVQMGEIVMALQSYQSTYGHFPVSPVVRQSAHPDFTYGGTLRTRAGIATVGTTNNNGIIFQNDQIIAVLMNFTHYPGTVESTINTNSQYNPKETMFLEAAMTGDTTSPGVGTDLVYRDPWGNPYVISLDLNADGLCEDAFYKLPAISTNGINGLIRQPDGNYAFHGQIMVWSAGPNKKVNMVLTAIQGDNHDNILSWR